MRVLTGITLFLGGGFNLMIGALALTMLIFASDAAPEANNEVESTSTEVSNSIFTVNGYLFLVGLSFIAVFINTSLSLNSKLFLLTALALSFGQGIYLDSLMFQPGAQAIDSSTWTEQELLAFQLRASLAFILIGCFQISGLFTVCSDK